MATDQLRGLRVLVAEDQMIVAMQIEDVLRDAGCEIIGPAATLEAALRLGGSRDLDAAILDVNLGGAQVFPLAEQLRGRGVPVILATGYSSSALPEAWRNIPRLNKPFTREQIESLLGKVVKAAG